MSLASNLARQWLSIRKAALFVTVKAGLVRKPEFAIQEVEDNPDPDTMSDHVVYVVKYGGWPKWADFKCPCGCDDVISISIARGKQSWRLETDLLARPSLRPSVWRKAGCRSHFWVRKGRVNWC